jgi:WhiB family redox-sensing transcriptional regulator
MSRASLSWHERAACIGLPLELFFPIGEVNSPSSHIARAKLVCGRCAVVSECLSAAIRTSEPEGIWGGLTPAERKALQRRRSANELSGRMDSQAS